MAVDLNAVLSEIKHHGVKGMRWGVRRSKIGTSSEVVVKTTPGRLSKSSRIKVSGGKGLRPSEDAVKAAVARQKVKKSGTNSLSNDELKALVSRMNLEQQLTGLRTKQSGNTGQRILKDVLVNVGKQQVTRLANEAASRGIDRLIRVG